MEFMKVDRKKCTGDAVCTKVCPVAILKMDTERNIPVPAYNAEEICIRCGHCVAVCPHGALSLASHPVDQLEVMGSSWNIAESKLSAFLKSRRSIRNFKDQSVEQQKIEKLIDIARYAPSGLNRQPVRWMVVHDPRKTHAVAEAVIGWMNKLIAEENPIAESLRMDLSVKAWEKGMDRICRGAPHLVIGYSLKENLTAAQAATIAFTYLELAAVSMGLGACWAGYVNYAINSSDEVRKLVGLSKRSACFSAMLIGYPQYKYQRIPKRDEPIIKWH